jgi:hypothetical protein
MLGRTTCEREPEMLAAAGSGGESADTRAHLASCARCREAVAVSAWMRRMANTSGESHALPDPGVLWWKAQLVRRWQAEREASAPVDAMHRAELWVGLLSLIGMIVWQGPGLVRWLTGAAPALDAVTVARWTTVFDSPAALMAVPVAAALLGLATLVTVTRLIMAE